jgi:hypothetical protein
MDGNSPAPNNASYNLTMMVENNSNKNDDQLLVRFQSTTHVLSFNIQNNGSFNPLLQLLSGRTGWPVSLLEITHINLPFVQVRAKSSILGGKGGFGTLLKGQSRQAGAKLTTDFGACRDLQGRRLRHVNDEIKLRKWRERQRREASGEKVEADDLWKTPSGIYNWHLMTPTWADISKKAAYRIKRQFKQMDRAEQKKAALKKEQEEMYKKTMTNYLNETTAVAESIQQDLGDAIKQGLKKASKKRKLNDVASVPASLKDDDQEEEEEESLTYFPDGEQPNALVSLTGEVVMETWSDNSQSVELQSKSEFMTAVLVLDRQPPTSLSSSSYYYEVTLVSGGLAQIGWACLAGDFQPNNETGDGVGDDSNSFAVDGSRGLKFHDGKESEYPIEWKAGDRLGCLLDNCDSMGTISFSLNGKNLGKAFSTKLKPLVPAFSCNQGEILKLHTSKEDCTFFPMDHVGVIAVKELFIEPETSKEPLKEEVKSETKPAANNDTLPCDVQEKMAEKITTSPLLPKEPVEPELLDLDQYLSIKELEALGLDRLKSALMALQVKCG